RGALCMSLAGSSRVYSGELFCGMLSPIMSVLDRFFGPSYAKELKQIQPIVEAVNALEERYTGLSDEDLRLATKELQERLRSGATSEAIMPEAFALVRESARRTLSLRHYDVQLIGGALLHRGRITEMRTGE